MKDSQVWLELIAAIGGVLGAMFFTVRYAIKETNKGKDSFMKFLKELNDRQLDYYETKNGHLERISEQFSKSIDTNTKAIARLTAKLKK